MRGFTLAMMRGSVVLLVALFASACGGTPQGVYPTTPTEVKAATLGPGDVIEIRVFYGSKEMNRGYRVPKEGTIAFPYIGVVQVGGRSESQVESNIQERLADGYLRNPIVSVDVQEYNSRKIAVFGQVRAPGTQSYFDGMTILEAISQAGGFNPMAKSNSVTVTRTVDGKKVKFTVPVGAIAKNEAESFSMQPGDAVFVPERLF